MVSDDGSNDLVELRPAPAVLLRHRDADLEVVTAPRSGPRVDLKRGALWIRAGEEGPGVTVTHGAASVQVRAGAGVVEVSDMEALLVVAAGRAAVKGVAPLPRSVSAGQAVTLTLDGTFTDPDVLSAAELAADRMVVENLALDNLAGGEVGAASPGASSAPPVAPLAPAPDPSPEAPADDPVARHDDGDGDGDGLPEPAPTPVVVAAGAGPAPAPAPPDRDDPAPPPAPATERSFLETALANVGVTDAPPEPSDGRAPRAAPEAAAPAPARTEAASSAQGPAVGAAPERPTATEDEERRRIQIIIGLVIGALLILALVTAVAFGGDGGSGALGP